MKLLKFSPVLFSALLAGGCASTQETLQQPAATSEHTFVIGRDYIFKGSKVCSSNNARDCIAHPVITALVFVLSEGNYSVEFTNGENRYYSTKGRQHVKIKSASGQIIGNCTSTPVKRVGSDTVHTESCSIGDTRITAVTTTSLPGSIIKIRGNVIIKGVVTLFSGSS